MFLLQVGPLASHRASTELVDSAKKQKQRPDDENFCNTNNKCCHAANISEALKTDISILSKHCHLWRQNWDFKI